MSCFQVARILLAAPRERTADHIVHICACARCARLAAAAAILDRELEQALLVDVPDSVADRVLIGHRWRRRRKGRIAVAAIAAVLTAALGLTQLYRPAPALRTVDARHPAVAAIAEVVRERGRRGPPLPRPDADVDLRRVGLNLPASEGRSEYVGACRVAGSIRCEHIVVITAQEQTSVLLVPDLPPLQRVLVADRRMVALLTASRSGGFIVVASSAASATRVEKLLLRSAAAPETKESMEAPWPH